MLIETKEAVLMGLLHKVSARTQMPVTVAENGEITVGPTVDTDGPTVDMAPPVPNNVVDLPVQPAREPGKPSPGKSRRTKAEMAEDDARAVSADPMAGPVPVDPMAPQPAVSDPDPLPQAADPMEETVGPVDPMAQFDTGPEAPAKVTNDDLLRAATEGQKIIGVVAVRAIIGGFGVNQLIMLDQPQREAFLEKIKDAIAAAKT